MSPNMNFLKALSALRVLLTGLVKWLPKRRPKRVGRHHLGSHAESRYIWSLLGKNSEESQEIIRGRNDRRTNGYGNVTFGEKEAEA